MRRRIAAFAAFVALVVAVLAAAPASAATEPLSPAGAEAFSQVAGCVAENGRLLAAIVVDDSGSLQSHDPENLRASAVGAILDSLGGLEVAGDGVEVEANLATFGKVYTERVGWGSPSGAHGDALRSAVGEYLRNRGGGQMEQQTDYRLALSRAQQSIDERAAAVPGPTCSVVLWFTDGALDVDFPDPVGAATEAARAEVCTHGGIVDSLREAGTHVIAMALFNQQVPEGHQHFVSPKDHERLQAVAEGTGSSCGTDPAVSGGAAGAYLMASDPGQLRALFSGAGALIEGATAGPSLDNTDGTLEIPVDSAVGGFRLILEALDEAPISLAAPAGSTVDARASGGRISGATVTSSGSDGLYVVDVRGEPSAMAGTWVVEAAPTTVRVIDLFYFWGAVIEPRVPAEGLVLGQANTVTVVAERGGVPDDAAWYDDLIVGASVGGTPVAVVPGPDGAPSFVVDLTGDGGRTSVRVDLTATAVTAGHAIALGPASRTVELPTTLPVGFPTVSPSALDLGRFYHEEAASGTLTVHGVPVDQVGASDTRVCLGTGAVWDRTPEGVVLAVATDAGADGCVTVAPGASRDVTVTLTASEAAEGVIEGVIPVRFEGTEPDQVHELGVPVAASLFRPVDESARWGLVALFTVLALLVAWIVAMVGRALTDRYRLGGDVRVASVPVRLTADGVQRVGAPAGDPVLRTDDFRNVSPRTAATFDEGGIDFARRGPRFWPYQQFTGVVSSPEGPVAVGSTEPMLDARRAPTEFAVTRQPFFVASPTQTDLEGPIDAWLVVFIDGQGGAINAQVEERNRDLRTGSGLERIDWESVAAALRQAVSEAAAPQVEVRDAPTRVKRRKPRREAAPEAPVPAANLAPPTPGFTPSLDYFAADRDPAPMPDQGRSSSSTTPLSEAAPGGHPSPGGPPDYFG
ncbi:hypothetical protein Xcel_1379 [Xylanimonas cellulosilytica DSM 15894]|uniref:VWFA domain-containing protein n=1 Tax=Xylanimonas cellulosilytica (strain DSM 15894 / JCM 12276 / CECT 5975 / KCTC 9989 / LMG 20990 / NBRC 107835 / XIL07) TaxID=446471 RepID=D1BRF5_XYLCX|nr:vWA domain-containing protein [Xylanimonas cellulosilytica]ACZ30410.1 hypothetical protein Xcel_1379 [Xylanimonas cellulosilytica DSM 15894]